MTMTSDTDVVARLDVRGLAVHQALARLESLLTQPPEKLAGVLIVDTVDGLASHDALFEQVGSSRQLAAALVVAVGRLGPGAELSVPATLQREGGAVVLWVGDPVGSLWRFGSPTASRLTRPSPDKALDRLLGVLHTPEVFRAVIDQPGSLVVSPALSLLEDGSDDEEAFLAALRSVLTGLRRGRDEAAPGGPEVHQAMAALEPVLSPGGAAPELVPGGPLERAGSAARGQVETVRAEAFRLSRLSSLPLGGTSLRRVHRSAGQLAQALSAQRETCAGLGEGVHIPGGGLDVAAIAERCRQYGLRLRRTPPEGTSIGKLVGTQVARWITAGASLSEIDDRLLELERVLAPTSALRYRDALSWACSDQLLDRLRKPAPFPPVPPALVPAGFLVGLLAGFAGLGSAPVTVAALVVAACVWGGLLVAWPASGPARAGWPLLAVLVLIAGGGLGHLGAAAAGPPPWIGALSAVLALAAAVVALAATWRRTCTEWVGGLGLDDSESAESGLTACVHRLAASEWAAAESRLEAVDAAILGRSITAGLRTALAPVVDGLESRLRPSDATPARSDYWSTVVDDQVRTATAAAIEPLWESVAARQPDALQREVEAEFIRLLATWIDGGSDRLMRDARGGQLTAPPALSGDAVDSVVRALAVDVADPMCQLVRPDDLSLLDMRREDVVLVRFAPAAVYRAARDRWRCPVTPLARSAAVGVLRLVPLRSGIATLRWPVATVDLRADAAAGHALRHPSGPRHRADAVDVTDAAVERE